MDGSNGSSGLDTKAGDTIVLQVPPDGPYGVNLIPDESGNAAVVHGFDKLPNGKFGPIQKHGGIHFGDVLTEINDTPLSSVSHREVLQMLANKNTLKKILKFQSPKVYYRKKNTMSYKSQPQDGKSSFLSAVKRSKISESGGKKYTEYEIACQYRLVGHKVQTEVVYQWSVWKRYSEFEALHTATKKALGWQMDGIDLPSAHTFVMNKLTPEFVEQRRDDLKDYWQKLISIDKVMDFAKHHCSEDIKSFLQVEENTKNKEVAATADMLLDGDFAGSSSADDHAKRPHSPVASASAAPSRRGSVRTNSRRINTKTLGAPMSTSTLAITDGLAELQVDTQMPSSSSTDLGDWEPCIKSPATAPAPPPRPTASVAAASPPPPQPRPTPAAAAAAPSTATASGAALPAKTPARANLLSSIAALRKD